MASMADARAWSWYRPLNRSQKAKARKMVSVSREKAAEYFRLYIGSLLASRFKQRVEIISQEYCDRLLSYIMQDIFFHYIADDKHDCGQL